MSWARHVKGGAQSSPLPPLTFSELNQVPIHCWVDSESFPVRVELQPVTFRTTAKHANHSTTTPLSAFVDAANPIWLQKSYDMSCCHRKIGFSDSRPAHPKKEVIFKHCRIYLSISRKPSFQLERHTNNFMVKSILSL